MPYKNLSFDPAINQPELLKAWQSFIKTGKIESAVVPAKVAESWIRSKKFGVDPYNFHPNSYLDSKNYKQRLSKNRQLIEISRPIMKSIHNSLEKTSYIVVLYDADGYHLLRIGKRKDFQRSKEFKIKEGLCFEEWSLGTCGFSLAKRAQEPIQIIGCEHYSSLLHYVTGSYAPIFDYENDKLIGIVGVTGAKTIPNDHTLAIVIASATAIENLIKIDKTRQNCFVLAKSLQIAINSIEDGLIVFDKSYRIVEMNSLAQQIIGASNFIGRHISTLKDFKVIHDTAIQCFKSSNFHSNDINCQLRGKMYLFSINLLKKNRRNAQGFVVHLKNIKKLTQIYHSITNESPIHNLKNIIASSSGIAQIMEVVKVASKTDACVIIEGESGSGKEVFAQCIHNESKRKNKPFVVIDCTAIPQELLESTLFGHEKGSFTGANATRIGKFELADKGTLFLDEIGDMSPAMQAKILRAIETRTIERVGGNKSIKVDVRIISATNRDLHQRINDNLFRADLFYRLNVFRILVPPLRARMDDIPKLVKKFIYEFAPMFNIDIPKISDDYLAALNAYNWPGNIRELKNGVQYSLAKLLDKKILTSRELKGFFPQEEKSPYSGYRELHDQNFYKVEKKPYLGSQEAIDTNTKNVYFQNKNLKRIEKKAILETLESFKGNKTKTAKSLGISRATLYRKLKD